MQSAVPSKDHLRAEQPVVDDEAEYDEGDESEEEEEFEFPDAEEMKKEIASLQNSGQTSDTCIAKVYIFLRELARQRHGEADYLPLMNALLSFRCLVVPSPNIRTEFIEAWHRVMSPHYRAVEARDPSAIQHLKHDNLKGIDVARVFASLSEYEDGEAMVEKFWKLLTQINMLAKILCNTESSLITRHLEAKARALYREHGGKPRRFTTDELSQLGSDVIDAMEREGHSMGPGSIRTILSMVDVIMPGQISQEFIADANRVADDMERQTGEIDINGINADARASDEWSDPSRTDTDTIIQHMENDIDGLTEILRKMGKFPADSQPAAHRAMTVQLIERWKAKRLSAGASIIYEGELCSPPAHPLTK
jgi:hypothetical protein